MTRTNQAKAVLFLALLAPGCGLGVVTDSRPVLGLPTQATTPPSSLTTTPPINNTLPSPETKPGPVLLAEGAALLRAGLWNDAISVLESAHHTTPGDAETHRLLCEAYNRRAMTRYTTNQIEQAIADLTRSLELNPAQPDIRMQLGRAHERLQRLNTSEAVPWPGGH